MFRKLLAIAVLGGLLFVAFHFSRNVRHEDDLVATLIFDSARDVGPGTPVVEKGEQIGEVTEVGKVSTKVAVTVNIPLEHRNRIFTDSVFEIGGNPPEVRVLSAISIGSPLTNGAVIVASSDRVSKFIAKGGERLAPHLAAVKEKALSTISEYDTEMFQAELDAWNEKVPEWKAEGKDVLKRNIADLGETVDEIEAALRKLERDAEADKIRRKFDDWVEGVEK